MKNNLKKLFAVLLTVALVATMFVMPSSAAYTNYADFASQSVVNGDFEAGIVGLLPYGWGLTSVQADMKLEKTSNWAANYTLATGESEDGNQYAVLTKNGTGYAGITSRPIAVEGGHWYRLSYDYMLASINYTAATFKDAWYGIRTAMRQYDKDGNLLGPDGTPVADADDNLINDSYASDKQVYDSTAGKVVYVDKIRAASRGDATEVTDTFSTRKIDVNLHKNTASVVFIIMIGGHYATKATANFDNITLEKYESTALVNGDGVGTTYGAYGARNSEARGPSAWSITAMEIGNYMSAGTARKNSFIGAHSLITATDSKGNDFIQLNQNGAGYGALTSNKISVEGGKWYRFSYDHRTSLLTYPEGKDGSEWYGIRTYIRQFDKDGNLLGPTGAILADASGNLVDQTYASQATYYNSENNEVVYLQILRTTTSSKGDGLEVTENFINRALDVKLFDNTASVVLYIGMAAAASYNVTVDFDNLSFEKYGVGEVPNGDLEAVVNGAQGGRKQYTEGPAGWELFKADNGDSAYYIPADTLSNDWRQNYKIVTGTGKNGGTALKLMSATSSAKDQGYVIIASPFIKVAAGELPVVSLDYKTEGNFNDANGNELKNRFRLWFYDKDGNFIAAQAPTATHIKPTISSPSTDVGPSADWTRVTIKTTGNSSLDKSNLGYVRVALWQYGSWNTSSKVTYIDNITVASSENTIYAQNGIKEFSTSNAMQPNGSWHTGFNLELVEDANRGTVSRVSMTDAYKTTGRQSTAGYTGYWFDEKIPVTAGSILTISFDYKIDGYAEALAANKTYQEANNGTPATSIGSAPRVMVKYYSAEGEEIFATTNGTVVSSTSGFAYIYAPSMNDCDWSTVKGDVTVPANAAYVQYGVWMTSGANCPGAAWIDHYYDNVVVKPATDSYWTTVYPNRDNDDSMIMYFFGGDANGDNGEDIRDLVRLNNKLKDKTVEINADGDMNANGMWDNDDITLLRWKLLGIDTSEEMSGNFNGAAAAVLKNKTILFCGDSITYNTGISWAYKVPNLTGAVGTPAGVSGAAVSTIRPANRVITQLHNHQNDYDYVVLHGGVNDAMSNGPIGEMSASFDLADFDTSTYAGGLEELFYYAHEYYPNSKIGYIVNYAVPLSATDANGKLGNYFAVGKQICEKWNIPYIDLYSGIAPGTTVTYSDLLDVSNPDSIYFPSAGDVHTNEAGYDILSPYIAQWIAGLGNNADPR